MTKTIESRSQLVHEDDSIQPSGVSVDGLTASWSIDPDKLVLSDISFTINKVGLQLHTTIRQLAPYYCQCMFCTVC